MRESRSYGSVRGVAGDRYPYRDSMVTVNGPPVCTTITPLTDQPPTIARLQ